MFKIKSQHVLNPEGYFEPMEILVEDGKIIEIGPHCDADPQVAVMDMTDAYVTPGLVDAHCHLGMWEDAIGFEGDDGNEIADPITPHLRAIDAINPMDRTFSDALTGGVTTAVTGPGSANVVGGQFAAIKTFGNRIDDMIIREPVAMKVAFGENPKRCYHEMQKSPNTRMAIAALLRETLYEAKTYYDNRKKGGEDQPDFNLKWEAFVPVFEKKIPLKAHAHRADDIFTAIRIAKEFDLRLTLDHCTDGALIADTLACEPYDIIVGPSFGERSKYELKNKTFDTPNALYQAGNKIAIMTDSPVIPLEYLIMCAALSRKAGLPEKEAWKAVTIHPAQIIGIDDRVGSLEKGKDADIVFWSANPLYDVDAYVIEVFGEGQSRYRRYLFPEK